MGDILPIEERIAEASARWPGLQFRKTGNEVHSPCPRCGGNDRFIIWQHGRFLCRQCDFAGWLVDDRETPLTEAEKLELRVRSLEAKQAEHECRLSALEKIHGMMHVAEFYHQNLADVNNDAFEYWLDAGMEIETIGKHLLGYCSRCPTDSQRRDSYTIPVIIRDKLYNIRHRIRNAEDGDKYRPEIAGLPAVLFNADYLYTEDTDRIVVCEGEKKSLILEQSGFANVGLMGKSGFKAEWAGKFARFQTVFVALDPDAEAQAAEIARLFKGRGRLVLLPGKLDDLLTQYGATVEDIEWFLKRARRV